MFCFRAIWHLGAVLFGIWCLPCSSLSSAVIFILAETKHPITGCLGRTSSTTFVLCEVSWVDPSRPTGCEFASFRLSLPGAEVGNFINHGVGDEVGEDRKSELMRRAYLLLKTPSKIEGLANHHWKSKGSPWGRGKTQNSLNTPIFKKSSPSWHNSSSNL